MKHATSLAIVGFLLGLNVAGAYEITTHDVLSRAAASQSVLGDQVVLSRLGLRHPITWMQADQLFPGSKGVRSSIITLIGNGSRYEDDFPPGPIYHFFDPRTNLPLHINPADYPDAVAEYVTLLNSKTRISPDWVVLGQGSSSFSSNAYSFPKARDYLYRGMTSVLNQERQWNLGRLFESLGRIIHHIEDMAQPQHVRNDNHLSARWADRGCELDLATMGLCESYLALRRPSAYEGWTDRPDILSALPLTGYEPVYPGTGAQPDGLRVFTMPRQFWVNARKGMAEYTNRNFFSAGTMNESPPYTDTPFDVDVRTLCTGATPSCELFAMANDYVTFFPSYVDDQFRPGNGPALHNYAAVESIFNPEFTGYTGQSLRSVNRFTFAKDYEFLMPRAVSYSAGLINYFFRGQMEIGLPDDGIYAIVDHSPDATAPAGCGTPCGFRKIKLKLKNTTPNDDMPSGKLVAVAKYHLNTCYTPSLSGEAGAPGFSASCRSTAESIVVSNEKAGQAVGRTADTLEFTFPDTTPIPINATDLYLQVVYRGKLGLEDDAVAVTTIDMREPTYLTFGDHYDYQALYNDDGSFARTEPFAGPGRYSVNIEVRFKANRPQPTAASVQLDPGNYHRIAILTDQEIVDYWLSERYLLDPEFLTRQWSFSATVNQNDAQNQPLNLPDYVTLRRITAVDWAYTPNLPGSVLYWGSHSSCLHGTTCNPVDQTVDAVARRYPPFQQPAPRPMVIDF